MLCNRCVEAPNQHEAIEIAIARVRAGALKKYPEAAETLALELEKLKELETGENSKDLQGSILFDEEPKPGGSCGDN